MPETPERPFTRLDFYMLLAATILGLGWAASAWPQLMHVLRWDLFYLGDRRGLATLLGDRALTLGAIRSALRLLAIAIAPPTLAVLLLRLRQPRPATRRGTLQPGVAACWAASALLIAEVAILPINLWTLYVELTRAQADYASNILQYPRLHGANLAGAVACSIGDRPGLAVLGVLLARRIAGLRSVGPSWLDRLGLGLGIGWIAVAVGFLLVPIGS